MPGMLAFLGIVLSVLLGSFVSATMGFGANVVALPLGTLWVDVKLMVPVLALLGVLGAVCLSIIERRRIAWRELGRIIVWTGIGFPFGHLGFSHRPPRVLTGGMGILLLGVGVHGLLPRSPDSQKRGLHPVAGRVLLVLGGMVHGAIVTGGPLIVAYAVHALPEKRQFRATLFALWVVLNVFFVAGYWFGPVVQPRVPWIALGCAPGFAVGLWTGQKIHSHVPQAVFRKTVFVLLAVTGLIRVFW